MSKFTRIIITPIDNASLRIVGPIRVIDAEGNTIGEGEELYLYRCGGSGNKPFCDGTHKSNGFQNEVRAK